MTCVVISQPMFFPWPGFFEQLALADVLLFLDDVQFSKGSFTNRVQIRFGDTTKWMTVPLAEKGAFIPINQLREANPDWRAGHRDMLRQSLRGARYAADALEIADKCYAQRDICDLLIASVELPAKYLGVGQNQRRARTAKLSVPGGSWQRVLELVRAMDGTKYVSGHGGARYLNHEAFESRGVNVEYMLYSLTEWPRGGSAFSPYVSVLDLIAHAGPNASQYLAPATIGWREFLSRRSGKECGDERS